MLTVPSKIIFKLLFQHESYWSEREKWLEVYAKRWCFWKEWPWLFDTHHAELYQSINCLVKLEYGWLVNKTLVLRWNTATSWIHPLAPYYRVSAAMRSATQQCWKEVMSSNEIGMFTCTKFHQSNGSNPISYSKSSLRVGIQSTYSFTFVCITYIPNKTSRD